LAHDFSTRRRFAREDTGARSASGSAPVRPHREQRTGLYWLFLIPIAATLLPWIFNSRSPELIGIPFFYWYQLLWVPLTVILTVWVYRATRRRS
jgi:Protein of unknown function (DUF3311)